MRECWESGPDPARPTKPLKSMNFTLGAKAVCRVCSRAVGDQFCITQDDYSGCIMCRMHLVRARWKTGQGPGGCCRKPETTSA